jgi:hypothetical protein
VKICSGEDMAKSQGVEVPPESCEAFVKEFLDTVLARGFGSLTKGELDVLSFQLLQKHAGLTSRSAHEISILLRLPESKVTRLRYEATLRHDSYSEKVHKERLRQLFHVARFEIEKHQMTFCVEDKFLRLEIQDRLQRKGGFSDSSFNPALVRVSIEAFVELLHESYDEKNIAAIEKEINKARKKSDHLSTKAMFQKYLEGVASSAGKKTVDLIAAGLTGGLSEVPTVIDTLKSFFDKGRVVEDDPNARLA